MTFHKLPERYQTSVNTFNDVADQYLAYFKDFQTYQTSYDWLLESMSNFHQRVLDVACGPGHVSHYLSERNPKLQLQGVDLAPEMIKLAKRLNPTGHYQVLDCRRITQLKQSFDVIICGFCLPYLSKDDSLQLMNDISTLLAPGGILYLSLTSGDETNGYQSSNSAAGQVYVHYHDLELIKATLEKSGLSVFKHEKISHLHNDKMITDEFLLANKI